MKLAVAHRAQPTAATLASAEAYLSRDDAGLGAGACSMLGYGATADNYAALGRLIRAGAEARGPGALHDVVGMVTRRGGRR